MGKKRSQPNRPKQDREDVIPLDMTPVIDSLIELDENLTATKGPDWVYCEEDYPVVPAYGETYTLGPKSIDLILELRCIGTESGALSR